MRLIKERGMTVVEIVVSIAILGLVSTGVMGFFTDSFEVQARSQQMAKAQKIAEETFEKLNDNKGVYNGFKLSDIKEANVERSVTLDNDKYECKLLVNAIDTDEDNEWVIYDVTINVNLESDKSIIGVVNSTIILDNWDGNEARESFTIEYVVKGYWIHPNPYRLSYYTDDTKITILEDVPTRPGYDFVAWMSDDGVSYEPGAEFQGSEYTVLTDDIWKAHEFTVTLNPGDGELDESKREIKVIYDGTYGDLPTPGVGDNPGYTREFKGWYTEEEGGEKRNPGDTVKITKDEELYAQYTPWVPCQYEVTFHAEPGTIIGSDTKIVTYDKPYGELPSAKRTGYNFDGWHTALEGGTEVTSDTIVTITAKQDLYAHWEAKQFTVTFVGIPVGNNTKIVTYDKPYGELPVVEKTGYNFDGWYTAPEGGEKIEPTTIVKITADQTLYPRLEAKDKIALTLDAGSNGGTVNGSTSEVLQVTFGEPYGTLPDAEHHLHDFKGWYTAAKGGTKIEKTTEVSNENAHTIYAQFDDEYTVKFDANGGSCDVTSIEVKYENTYGTLPVAKLPDGTLNTSWNTDKEGNGSTITSSTIYNVDDPKDHTLYAIYPKKGGANLEYNANANGNKVTDMPDNQSATWVMGDDKVEFDISNQKPKWAGNIFKGWATTSDAKEPNYKSGDKITVANGNTTTLYAVWEGIPVLAQKDTWFDTTKANRKNITKISIQDAPYNGAYQNSWPADVEKSGSIKCYVNGTNLIIAGNGSGSIMANKNANYMFSYQDMEIDIAKEKFDEFNAKSFINLKKIDGLDSIDFSNTTNVYALFAGCKKLGELDNGNLVVNINTSNVKSGMSQMFRYCETLKTITFGENFKTDGATLMSFMFANCTSLETLDLSSFNFEDDPVYDDGMNSMFQGCSSLTKIELPENFGEGSNSYASMFYGCEKLESINLANFDTSKLKNTEIMFCDCKSLTSIGDISNFDTSKVIYMKNMFRNCASLTSLDLSSFDTSNVLNMYDMFNGCKALKSLNISSFNTKKVNNIGDMFVDMGSLEQIRLGPNFTFYGDGVGPEGKGTSCNLPLKPWFKEDGTQINSTKPEEGTRKEETTYYKTNPQQ